MPSSVRLKQMDDGSGILCTLSKNGVKYHELCRNRYDDQKLSRLLASSSATSDKCRVFCSMSTRSSLGYVDITTSCLFCDNPSTSGNRLVSVCTKDTGPKIHAQAAEIQHTKLLAKMASTDFMALEVNYHKDCYIIQFRNSCRSHQRAIIAAMSVTRTD